MTKLLDISFFRLKITSSALLTRLLLFSCIIQVWTKSNIQKEDVGNPFWKVGTSYNYTVRIREHVVFPGMSLEAFGTTVEYQQVVTVNRKNTLKVHTDKLRAFLDKRSFCLGGWIEGTDFTAEANVPVPDLVPTKTSDLLMDNLGELKEVHNGTHRIVNMKDIDKSVYLLAVPKILLNLGAKVTFNTTQILAKGQCPVSYEKLSKGMEPEPGYFQKMTVEEADIKEKYCNSTLPAKQPFRIVFNSTRLVVDSMRDSDLEKFCGSAKPRQVVKTTRLSECSFYDQQTENMWFNPDSPLKPESRTIYTICEAKNEEKILKIVEEDTVGVTYGILVREVTIFLKSVADTTLAHKTANL